jgi:hypothetical protein
MAAAAVSGFGRIEGVEGNVHASRAWKGNENPRPALLRLAHFSPSSTNAIETLFAIRRSLFARLVMGD